MPKSTPKQHIYLRVVVIHLADSRLLKNSTEFMAQKLAHKMSSASAAAQKSQIAAAAKQAATLESRRRAPFRGWMCENCQEEQKMNWQKREREIHLK